MSCEPRWATQRVLERPTLGHAMANVAAELGTPFMPWQRRVADVALERDPDTGRLVYREVRLTVPRQSGKTTILLALMLTRALGAPDQDIRYTAQTGLDARKKWGDDWLPVLDASRFARFYRKRLATGHEALKFRNGSMQGLVASNKQSGHGGTIDLAMLDEAFAHKDARLEQSLKPAQITRPQPQTWIVSTAGTPNDSPYLWGKVQGGRAMVEQGVTKGTCYFEWSAPDGDDPADPATWRRCMPALGHTITEDAIAGDFQSMADEGKLSEFERAYLNRWVTSLGDPIVSIEAWRLLAKAEATRPPWVVLSLDLGPQDSSASIVVTGEMEYGLQSTVLTNGPGTGWLLGSLAEYVEKYDRPFVVVDAKHCQHMLPEIERVAGFDRVRALSASDMAAACSFWLRLAKAGKLWHRGEPELTAALAGAGQRSLLDGWAWSRAKSGTDITPLVAQTLGASFWVGPWGDDGSL